LLSGGSVKKKFGINTIKRTTYIKVSKKLNIAPNINKINK
jgi:hypothetical protein